MITVKTPGFVAPQLAEWAHLVVEPSDPTTENGKIYLGPRQAAGKKQFQALQNDASPPIGAIVNCTKSYPNHHENDEIAYCRIAVNDDCRANILVYLEGSTKFIHHHVVQGKSVLVHCQMGISRSATVVIAYLMQYRSMSKVEAFQHVKVRRPMVRPNDGFWNQLDLFEQKLAACRDAKLDDAKGIMVCFDRDWAEKSLAKYQTLRHITDDSSQHFAEVTRNSDISHVLNVAIDYVFGRGLLDPDLNWLSALCNAMQRLGVDVKPIVTSIFDEGSTFMEMWSGEVHPEFVLKIKETTFSELINE